MGPVHRWRLRAAAGRRHVAPRRAGTVVRIATVSYRAARVAVRAALIGPVPPQLGGATPGGVATHQLHLAAGLAAAGIDAPLLATNTCVSSKAWRAGLDVVDFPMYRMARPDDALLDYVGAAGP